MSQKASKPNDSLNLLNLIDQVEINENDVRFVEKGMFLNKLNIKRKKFEEVFYKLDLVNHQLIASKKSISKNKKYCKDSYFIQIIY
jgi:hypothetical protein